jgi:hypothetical protein
VQGREVLTAHAPILPLRWLMFVELPIDEAYAPLYESIKRSSYLLMGGLMLAFLAGLFLRRKMIIPIQKLREGARRSAPAISSSASRSRPATSWNCWPTSSTTWRDGWRKLRRPRAEGRAAHATS